MRLSILFLFYFILACTEGNPVDPFEGSKYYTAIGKTEQYISVDSIKELPNSINSATYSVNLYNFNSGRDTAYLNQFDSLQNDSLVALYSGLNGEDLFYYYSDFPKFSKNIYKSIYFIKRVLSVVDDGLLPLNIDRVQNGGLRVITVTDPDTINKSITIDDTTAYDLVNITIKEKKTSAEYFSEFTSADSFFTKTNIFVRGKEKIDHMEHYSTSKFGLSTIKYTVNHMDTALSASFVITTPIQLVDTTITTNDSILIKGFVFAPSGYTLIRAYLNSEDNPFYNSVRDSGVADLKEQLADSTARGIFFWTIDNDAPFDTNSVALPIDSSRIEEVNFKMCDKFYSHNHFDVATEEIQYFKSSLHLYYIRDNMYFMRDDGQFNYYGEEVPSNIQEYIAYEQYLDSIKF